MSPCEVMRKIALGESDGPLRSGKRYCKFEQKNLITRLTAGVIAIGMHAKGSELPLLTGFQGLDSARCDMNCCTAEDSDSENEVVRLFDGLTGIGNEDDVEEDRDLADKGRASTADVGEGETTGPMGLLFESRDRRSRPRRRWAKRET